MPAANRDELPTVDLADLTRVTGGSGDDATSMMMMMAMRNRQQSDAVSAAAAAPAPAAVPPWTPQITVNGVPQQLSQAADGSFSTSQDV